MQVQERLTVPTFVIGLGGIGNAVVRHIQERFITGLGKVPETVLLRSFDTAAQEAMSVPRLGNQSFTRLGNFAANEVVSRLDLYSDVERWWRYPQGSYALGFVDNGANAKRPVGRMVFFQKFQQIVKDLREDFGVPLGMDLQERMTEAGLGRIQRTPRVFIVGSLSGGTGAGMFIDTAILTRYLLASMGYERSSIKISGVFALPSVIHAASNDELSPEARRRRLNAYSSLCEMDYLMDGSRYSGVSVSYPQPIQKFEPIPPFLNEVYFFTDTTMDGRTFDDQAGILLRAAHFVFGQIAMGTGEKTLARLDNMREKFDPAQRQVADGQAAVYGTFGVEWLEAPRKYIVDQWAGRIGREVADRVAELEWEKVERQNLESAVRSRLLANESLAAIVRALDLSTIEPVAAMEREELSAQGEYLRAIERADSPDSLRTELQALESSLDALSVKSTLRRQHGSVDPAKWAAEAAAGLLRDREFRAGGARRVLRKAAEMLRLVAHPEIPATLSVSDVVANSRKGLLKRRVDTGAAYDWARDRSTAGLRRAVSEALGTEAERLAEACLAQEKLLQTLQEQVRSAGSEIAREAKKSVRQEDLLLVDENDVARAIESSFDQVVSAVSSEVSEGLSRLVEDGSLEELSSDELRDEFSKLALRAIEREAVSKTSRPEDAVDRLKRKMSGCSPLANTHQSGAEYLEVMTESQRPSSVKLVLTTLTRHPESERQLQAWSQYEQREDPNAFQIVPSDDELSDDVLHLSVGWPLCLFFEARQCRQDAEVLEREDPSTVRFSRVLGEFPGSETHTFWPRSKTEISQYFGIAFALGHINFEGSNAMTFEASVFPNAGRVEGEGYESVVRNALQRFSRSGLAGSYRKHVEASMRGRRAAWRDDLLEKIGSKREKLEAEAKRPGSPMTLEAVQKLQVALDAAEGFAQSIVDL